MVNKPTFGVSLGPKQEGSYEDIQKKRSERPEVGAIWENTTKSQSKYMNIRFKIPKSELLKLIEDSSLDNEGKVTVSFIAFPNKKEEPNSKRPSFRIYKELSKPSEE
jgi:uncharacterized protein (DUF736 family)